MPPRKLASALAPHLRYNVVLNRAHARTKRRLLPNRPKEPEYVLDLISRKTVQALNWAARKTYDWQYNRVYFRAGFLHGYPLAKYDAQQPVPPGSPSKTKPCSRELADALLIVYETAPDKITGKHSIVKRHACLLMFKRTKTAKPKTPRFIPGLHEIPEPDGDSDKEQFYLFNQWPDFEIHSRSQTNSGLAKFNLRDPHGNPQHDIGKYALVWDGASSSSWQMVAKGHKMTRACWLATDPEPRTRILDASGAASTSSLGHLLEQMIDNQAGVGRSFNPLPAPLWPGTGGWDELMGFMLGYQIPVGFSVLLDDGFLQKNSKSGLQRNVNPAHIQFIPAFGPHFEHDTLIRANMYQRFRNKSMYGKIQSKTGHGHLQYLVGRNFPRADLYLNEHDNLMPVLVATVNHAFPLDEEKHKG